MKKITSIIILTGILCQLFSSVIIIASFKVNQDYIARQLCENKSKPEMNCKGHCQLKKQLQEEDKKETSAPVKNKETSETVFCNALKKFEFFNNDLPSALNSYYNAKLPSPTLHLFFHPPIV